MVNKKGELTSKQLITIIILIISFAIIIVFFVSLGLRQTVDSETCRNSVILRGSLPFGSDAVQLKCKTTDICLSMGGDCGVVRKGLVTIEVRDENELIKEMVNLLWDCWWKMGEGKVDYMSAGLGFEETYCSVCSKVIFDNKIKAEYPEGIPYSLIYQYMQANKIPERDESYLFGIYKVNSLNTMRTALLDSADMDILKYNLDPNQEQVVATAMVKDGWAEGLIAGGAVALGVAGIALAPFTFGGSLALTASVGLGLGAGTLVGVSVEATGEDEKYLAPIFIPFTGKDLEDALKCEEYVTEG